MVYMKLHGGNETAYGIEMKLHGEMKWYSNETAIGRTVGMKLHGRNETAW